MPTSSTSGDIGEPGLQQLTKTNSILEADLSVTSTSVSNLRTNRAPITNLPLPRELRDEIYGYLLDGRIAKYFREKQAKHSQNYTNSAGAAHTYKFRTGLLAVNKTIGGEASHYLYHANTFVVINSDMHGFNYLIPTMDIPIVAESGLDHFNQHTLSIKLKWNQSPLAELFRSLGGVVFEEGNRDKGRVLMLMQDFSRFCSMLKFLCQYTLPPTVLVTTERGVRMKPVVVEFSDLPVIRIMLRATAYNVLSDKQQEDILREVGTITGAGYRLKAGGGFESSVVEEMRRRMSPSLVWLRAKEWDRLDTALQYKQVADSLALSGNSNGAIARYCNLLDFTNGILQRSWPAQVPEQDCNAVFTRTKVFHFDLVLSRAVLKCRIGQYLIEDGNDVCKLSKSPLASVAPASMYRKLNHVTLLLILVSESHVGFRADRLEEIVRNSFGLISRSDDPDDHASHDMDLLQAALPRFETDGIVETIRGLVNELSVRALPFQIYDSRPDSTAPTRPPGLVGWQDLRHLAELSGREKRLSMLRKWTMCMRLLSFDRWCIEMTRRSFSRSNIGGCC